MTALSLVPTVPTSLDLPALLSRASQILLDARSSAEVLEAKRIAELALHYAKVTRAANASHGDCILVIGRAEILMADEVDKGQANGEIATADGDNQYSEGVQSLDRLGIDRRRLADWRQTRDAGIEKVEEAIQAALQEDTTPTLFGVRRYLRGDHVRGTFGTGDNEWFTPPQYIAAARQVLGQIDLDPATHPLAQRTVGAKKFFTAADDGLSRDWRGRIWLNPPYVQPLIGQFVDKLLAEIAAGRAKQAILLTHNYTDTTWFHSAESRAALLCFTRGRVKFLDPDGDECAPTQGQAFFYYGEDDKKFRDVFGAFGFVR